MAEENFVPRIAPTCGFGPLISLAFPAEPTYYRVLLDRSEMEFLSCTRTTRSRESELTFFPVPI